MCGLISVISVPISNPKETKKRMRIYYCCLIYDSRIKKRSCKIKIRAVCLKEEFSEIKTVIIRRKVDLKVGESEEGKSEIYLLN